ncbi:MAG TPA: hypothetical protein VIN71_14120 [Pseudomonadales bacterium]
MAGIFSTCPAVIVFCLGFIAWPSVYLTIPVFYPYAAYSTNASAYYPTIFHMNAFGHWFFAGHSLVVGILSALSSRSSSWGKACMLYGVYAGCEALFVHIALHLIGFSYVMEAP